MAYKIQKVSPSALAATDKCPRFRPNGEENQAAIDGTMMHDFAEKMVSVPRGEWESWIATREASSDMKGMLEEIAAQLRTIIVDDLPVFVDYRLRMRAGKPGEPRKPRKTPLKPGLYPELELERGQGRHGRIDLMIVTPEGYTYIVDYKSNRVEKDFSLQLAAYACDVNRLAPAHEMFECRIIAPRLDDEAQLSMKIGKEDIAKYNKRIAEIEERADRSANDDSIPGCPNDACQYCHWNGTCKYQANAAVAVLDEVTTDIVHTTNGGKITRIDSLATLTGPGGVYEGEVLAETTFTAPATTAQRGLRRSCLKFLETLIDASKADDTKWVGTHPGETVPGWVISRVRGRASVDGSRTADIREAVMSRFGLSMEDVFDLSSVDMDKLADQLIEINGWTKKKAKEEIDKALEPFMVTGAPSVRWNQEVVRKHK